jgi:hypothetical protein
MYGVLEHSIFAGRTHERISFNPPNEMNKKVGEDIFDKSTSPKCK